MSHSLHASRSSELHLEAMFETTTFGMFLGKRFIPVGVSEFGAQENGPRKLQHLIPGLQPKMASEPTGKWIVPGPMSSNIENRRCVLP